MSYMINIRQDVQDYINTLTNDNKITTALDFATKNRDCGPEVVKQAVEKQHGNDQCGCQRTLFREKSNAR